MYFLVNFEDVDAYLGQTMHKQTIDLGQIITPISISCKQKSCILVEIMNPKG